MALQSRLLEKLLRADGNAVEFFPSNFALPTWPCPFGQIPGVRTALRAILIWPKLWGAVRRSSVVHIFAASWLYFYMVVWLAVILGRACGKRIVVNYRGGDAARFFRSNRWLAKPVFLMADVITAPSRFLAGIIEASFQVPVLVVSNILDLSVFQFHRRLSFSPRFLTTRHLEKIYDIETALRAFRAIQESYPESSLWIAGTGSQEQHLRGLADEWKLQNVKFLGHVAHRDLPAIFSQCDILMNASRLDNFPGALMEASAAGLAVVSTDAGGIPFMYQDGKNALLVAPGDWRGLAAAAIKVLDSPSLGQELAKAGATLARTCDWQEVRRVLYQAYGFSRDPGEEQEATGNVRIEPQSSLGRL
jgi:glycosyltransferase involved in cell wall biosynthesis